MGYKVAYQSIKPDPDRVQSLLDMPIPKSTKESQRMAGLFAYFARWVSNYSSRIRSLIKASMFPLTGEPMTTIEDLKHTLANATSHPIDDRLPLTVETDASAFAIAATLNQDGRPVTFHSRTLFSTEQKHFAAEKEAYAVVEALQKWRHLLIGRHFTLVTDQKSVSHMLDTRHANKIKNEKILRWQIELAPFSYTSQIRKRKRWTRHTEQSVFWSDKYKSIARVTCRSLSSWYYKDGPFCAH